MKPNTTHEVTKLLLAWNGGEQEALDKLIPIVQAELHRLAKRYLTRERAGHTLQATALVNEAYMRLVNWKEVQWQNRAHFFGLAARLMRHILVDYARKRHTREGNDQPVELEEAAAVFSERSPDLVALDDALNDLARLDERQCRIVELKFFGGLTNQEVATALGVSVGLVKNDWSDAKTWLHQALSREDKGDS